jgi:hypothetical protein
MSSGINLDKLHEKEVVSLRLDQAQKVSSLTDSLASIGFRKSDDFCFFPRVDRGPAWQSDTVTTATFYLGDSELCQYLDEPEPDSTDSACDEIRFDYLLASLPQPCIGVFLSLLRSVQRLVGGRFCHLGEPLDINTLETILSRYVADIEQELAEDPGSEFLAIYISQSYSRRNSA